MSLKKGKPRLRAVLYVTQDLIICPEKLGFKPTFVGLQINFALTTRRTYQKTHLRGPVDLPRWAIEQGR